MKQNQRSANPTLSFISGMGLGAGIMYALDPERGHRRRAMAQQKLYRLLNLAGDAVDKGVRDLQHRAEGLVAETTGLFQTSDVSDDILEQRVRSKLGRVACHPGSIEVHARGGNIVLTGPVLRGEIPEIERAVHIVRGVRGVDCRLEEHDSSANIPGLQGAHLRGGDKPELLQENWAPGTRLVMGGLGLTLLARGIRNPGLANTTLGILGLGLLARSGRRTRIVGEMMDALQPARGPRAGSRRQASGQGRRDVVGRSGVYPATGPFPTGPAEVRMAGSFGGSYQEHGSSEMTYTGGQVLGALTGSSADQDVDALLRAREIAPEQWLSFFNQFDKAWSGKNVTVEIRDGGNARTEQRDVPLGGIGADVKDRECTISVSLGSDPDRHATHLIQTRRVAVRDQGRDKLIEIEGANGAVTIVHLGAAGMRPGAAA